MTVPGNVTLHSVVNGYDWQPDPLSEIQARLESNFIGQPFRAHTGPAIVGMVSHVLKYYVQAGVLSEAVLRWRICCEQLTGINQTQFVIFGEYDGRHSHREGLREIIEQNTITTEDSR